MHYILPEVAQLASTLLFNFIDPSSNPDGGEKKFSSQILKLK